MLILMVISAILIKSSVPSNSHRMKTCKKKKKKTLNLKLKNSSSWLIEVVPCTGAVQKQSKWQKKPWSLSFIHFHKVVPSTFVDLVLHMNISSSNPAHTMKNQCNMRSKMFKLMIKPIDVWAVPRSISRWKKYSQPLLRKMSYMTLT